MTATLADRPRLGYRYEFNPDELDAIAACLDEHGFAVVKQLVSDAFVREMRQAVLSVCDPFGTLGPGQTRVRHAFCDAAPQILQLLDHQPWLAIQRRLLGTDQLTVHRCAAILKNIGAPPVTWHTDWTGHVKGEPRTSNDVLNRGERPNGAWFYLEGTHPSRAGLAIIPDSHRIDWSGPEGFTFTEARRSFYPTGTEPRAYDKLDVPGAVALVTDPGDMILFAARTYHYATEHHGSQPRTSCALGLRAGCEPFLVPWEEPESVRHLKRIVPERYKPYLEYYVGYTEWRAK